MPSPASDAGASTPEAGARQDTGAADARQDTGAADGTGARAEAADTEAADTEAADTSDAGRPARRAVTATHLAVVVVGAYVGAQVIANVSSVKIGSTFGRAVDMGTFVYPLTFTLRDLVHKTLGKRMARTVVLTAAGVNLFLAAYLQWVVGVRPDASYPFDEEFAAVLGPLWRIVVASIVAQVISELVDGEIYHWFVRRVTTRYQWARVAVSNVVSVPLDNAIFAVGAFGALPFLADDDLTLPWAAVWDVFLVNLVVKGAVSALSLPLIYLSPDRDWRADPDDA